MDSPRIWQVWKLSWWPSWVLSYLGIIDSVVTLVFLLLQRGTINRLLSHIPVLSSAILGWNKKTGPFPLVYCVNPRMNFVHSTNISFILKCFKIQRYTIACYQRHAVFQLWISCPQIFLKCPECNILFSLSLCNVLRQYLVCEFIRGSIVGFCFEDTVAKHYC